MNKNALLSKIEGIIEVDAGTLDGTENLDSLLGWDSLGVLGFIAMADEEFGIQISAKSLTTCETVADLIGVLGNNISE
jgi:acyl carrier protein